MKVSILLLLSILGLSSAVLAGNDKASVKWQTDFEAARAEAQKLERPILADFTGSDWCPPCIRLKQEVLSKPEFEAFAESELVLFVADFPRRIEQPEAIKTQNESLSRRYNVRGFPTILLLDAQGNEIARTGYRPGGVKAYLEHLKKLLGD